MRYRQWAPHPTVRSIIDCWWTLEGTTDAQPHSILPDGCAELVFHIGDPMQRVFADGTSHLQARGLVVGQMSTAITLRPSGLVRTVGARLRPAAARALLGVPAHELTDRIEEIEDVAPSVARLLGSAVQVPSVDQCSAAIERRLTESLQGRCPDRVTSEAVAVIERMKGRASINDVRRGVGASARELERRFQRDVGLSPKLFSRIVRFQRAVAALVDGKPRLIDAALSGGYYDQPHFNREFAAFAGVPPNIWFARDCELSQYFTAAHRDRARERA